MQIDFEDGFENDTVIVSAAGRELWRGESLTTNLSSNLAAVAQVEVEPDARVEIRVPTRDLHGTVPTNGDFLVVRIAGRELQLLPSENLPYHA